MNYAIFQEQINHCPVFLVHWNQACSEFEFATELSDSDQEYLNGLTHSDRRIQMMASRFLLRKQFQVSPNRDSTGVLSVNHSKIVSISHKTGVAAVTCFETNKWQSVGLDIEKISTLNVEIQSKICSERELSQLDSIAEKQTKLALIFSAKEALFKSHFYLARQRFYFQDVELQSCTNDKLVFRNLKVTGEMFPKGFLSEVYFKEVNVDGLKFMVTLALIPLF